MILDADVYVTTNTYNEVYKKINNETNLINYIPRYDQLLINKNQNNNNNTPKTLDKQCKLLNLTNYAGFVSFHLKDLEDIGGYEEHSFFDGPGALGKDLYIRFRNYGKKIQWLYNYKIFHPLHNNSNGNLMPKNKKEEQILILNYREKNISYLPLKSTLCSNHLKINFTHEVLKKKKVFSFLKIFYMRKVAKKLLSHIHISTNTNREIFLASFPKSGNAWIRFVLGNIYNKLEKQTSSIDFHTIHEIIPEEGQKVPKFKSLPKIFKTHSLYKNNFKKVILILRNPSDTLYSYYKYLNGEKNLNLSLSEVIYSKQYGIDSIIKHTNSYTRNCNNLLIITYEKMKNNPIKTTKQICDFLKINLSDEIIAEAINKSSFESMRKIELEKGRKFGNNDFLFTRKEEEEEGIRKIKKEDSEYIKKILKKSPILNLLYN